MKKLKFSFDITEPNFIVALSCFRISANHPKHARTAIKLLPKESRFSDATTAHTS